MAQVSNNSEKKYQFSLLQYELDTAQTAVGSLLESDQCLVLGPDLCTIHGLLAYKTRLSWWFGGLDRLVDHLYVGLGLDLLE